MAAPFGRPNPALNLDSVSPIAPPQAGILSHRHGKLHFQPSAGFQGPVWFSYTLRGSLGNDGEGWLHKGDVTLLIGQASPNQVFRLAPGETRTLFVGDAQGKITQPVQSRVHTLQDHDSHLLIRVQQEALGTDSFRVGTKLYEISYLTAEPAILLRANTYHHHPNWGTLRLFPLANDTPSSTGGLDGNPQLSIGLSEDSDSWSPFPRAFRLVDAENLSPEKGSLEIVTAAGQPTGELRFTPFADSEGLVTLRYNVLDPSGQLGSQEISIYLVGAQSTLVAPDAIARYHIPKTAKDSSTWMLPSYDDRTWLRGDLPIGYEDGRGYEDWITTDVSLKLANKSSSLYVRVPFKVENPSEISQLQLRMRVDDGFVAYLNGRRVARENAPLEVAWNSKAIEGREADAFDVYDLSDARSVLLPGENLLGIQALNARIDSSDFLVMPELTAFSIPLLAKITSPAAASVSVDAGTGIRFDYRFTESEPHESATAHWAITEASSPVSLLPSISGDEHAHIFFDQPGTYRVRLTAQDQNGATTIDERVIRVRSSRALR